MSRICHRVVAATIPYILRTRPQERPLRRLHGHDIPALLHRFAATMPEQYRPLLVGPIPHDVNGGETWFFSSAGSKGGDEPDGDVYDLQEQFVKIFDRPECFTPYGGHLCSVVVITWPDEHTPGYGSPVGAVRRV